MFKLRSILVLVILLFSIKLFSKEYEITDAESWVIPTYWDVDPPLPEDVEDGEYYHLFEQQTFLEEKNISQYKHHVIELININGVENNSQISIDFDPSYEKLLLHDINIIRNGNNIDKLKDAQISLFHRETDMDALLFDGTKTFSAILKDVRPGDILDYSYTIIGYNPVFKNKFSKKYYLEWSVPVNKVYVRLINKKRSKLFFNYKNETIEPTILDNDIQEYIWENSANSSLNWESNTPSWYSPLNTVEVSEFSSWLELKKWAIDLFVQEFTKDEINNVYTSIVTTDMTTEEKLFSIIAWVQNEIRYLGLESGVDSYKPTTPDITLERRFGDCKDKSFLSVELLGLAGIKAWPVLVNTKKGKTLNKSLPMTGLFNHVIIVVEMDNKLVWIDPTDTYQRGGLKDFYQPNYFNALVLDNSDKTFVSMDKGPLDRSNFHIEYEFDLRPETALFNVTATSKFDEADYQRYKFESNSKKKMQEEYINFYSKYYPEITQKNMLEIQDSKDINSFRTLEQYTVPDLWVIDEDTDKKEVDLYPIDISAYIYKPSDRRRKMPISLNYPIKVTQNIIVNFNDEQGTFDNDSFNLSSEYIEFDFKSSFEDGVLTNTFMFRTLKDHVPIEDVKQYLKDIDKIQDKMSYSYYEEFEKEITGKKSGTADIVGSLFVIIVMIAFFINKGKKKNRVMLT